jgi:nucleoside 2-deoxyribosyltransferase
MPTQHKKSNKRKIHCFVAMAFGRPDTDLVYTKHISKAIQDVGMIPMRVDKIIHNERIDIKIRDLIRKADVVVADLTYARPSAYWEAGYAEREVPVVYTCRSDHLQAQPDDTNGNLQIHFDLRNTNLITWSGIGIKQFRENLRKRLLHVTRQLRIDIEEEANLRLEREKFSILSTNQRNQLISLDTHVILREHGFEFLDHVYSGDRASSFSFDPHMGGRVYSIYWKKMGNVAFLILNLPCVNQLLKGQLIDLRISVVTRFAESDFVLWENLPKTITKLSRRKIHAIRRLVLIPTLGIVPIARLDSVFYDWQRTSSYLHYFNPRIELHGRLKDKTAAPSSSELLIVDDVKSTSDYNLSLSDALRVTESERTTILTPSN